LTGGISGKSRAEVLRKGGYYWGGENFPCEGKKKSPVKTQKLQENARNSPAKKGNFFLEKRGRNHNIGKNSLKKKRRLLKGGWTEFLDSTGKTFFI